MTAFSFFSTDFESLGYLVRTPSTAVEDETERLTNASRSSPSLKYGLVSFKDFFFMLILYRIMRMNRKAN
ncbi:MAG: hypothetical protein C0402_04520 [Thermodesulfovibrio sp.]|nr:hypothetical protein [Thermodesulfovibrio sp.]